MNINKFLHDIINQVIIDHNKNSLKTAIFNDGSICIVNLDKIKFSPILKGADVMKMLFGIHEDNPFKHLPMQESDGCITILRNLDISQSDWILFESFITHGELMINNLKSFEAIERLNIVCLKLGGVPEFDKIYEKQSNNWVENKKDLEKYNPSEPKEDKLNKYNWIIFNSRFCNLAAFIISLQKEDSDWSSTKNEGDIYYWRRLKKIDT